MLIGPQGQKKQEKIIGVRKKIYRILYVPVILGSLSMIFLFFYGNYKINFIQEEYYVYGNNKYKLIPKIDEDIPHFKEFIPDTISNDSIYNNQKLSKHLDLRHDFSSIKNQGKQGSCLAFALSSIMEYLTKKKKNKIIDFSEAFLYYKSREKAGEENIDRGSHFIYATETLKEIGICFERIMPYNEYDYTTPPSQNAYDNALENTVLNVNTVNQKLEDLKFALMYGYPIAISVKMFPSFGNGQNGVIPIPKKRELYGGSHAMAIVGYDDDNRMFIVRNSWGTNFGDNGYCYMSYDYITDENLVEYACVIIIK